VSSRRELLASLGSGFGLAALAAESTHFPARAKRIIYLVLNGGLSQVDSFDPKPALDKHHGQPVPGGAPKTESSTGHLMRSPFAFARHGQSGTPVSEIFPNMARVIDHFCVIRSMHTNVPNHEPSLFMINAGTVQPGRPSLGSWLMYGLGSMNRNLPGFVVMCPGMPVVGAPLWESAFLPAVYQGTFVQTSESDPYKLIRHSRNGAPMDQQRKQLDLLKALNQRHLEERPGDSQLEASIAAMETAFRMQTEAPEVFDISREPEPVRKRYGDSAFGRGCLMALRLAERGVRMVQVYYGASQPWDSHDDILSHKTHARRADPAIAALVEDLRSRGLFDDTLLVVGTEFGRTPAVQNSSTLKLQNGRDHNSLGYTILLAGGGVKGGYVHGATDDFGFRAVDKPVHVHDLNATLLQLMGLDHTRLTYHYSGRDFRLTDVHGDPVRDILA